MIASGLYAAFIAATLVLLLIPGPNVAAIVATSVAHGTRAGLVTVLGTSSAAIVQLALVTLGLSAALAAFAQGMEVLRWLGAAYLIALGIAQWCAPVPELTSVAPLPRRAIYGRGFAVALTNPKTLFFYAAFFPQFIAADRPFGAQIAVLGATFLGLALLVDGGWAVLGGRLRGILVARGRLRRRLAGTALIGAGVGLALARGR
jgi:homoserine/homoserine lactone efflux protein